MRAIIPVAGVGSRLRPHTYTVPKVLLNVAGKPIISHLLDKLIDVGFDEITMVIGHLGDRIKEYVQKNYRIKFDFVEQEERLGLGHAIYICRHTVSNNPLLIILGDTIFEVDLKSIIKSDYSQIGVKMVEDPRRYGIAEVNNDFVTRLIEKPDSPKSSLAIVGLYYIKNPKDLFLCLEEMISSNKKTKGEFQLTDALQMMIERGEKMQVFNVDGWYDCGKPETLLSTNRYLLKYQSTPREIESVIVHSPSYISEKAIVSNSIIGPYATIADGARIENSIIKNSIIGEGANVLDSLLEDSIVGNNATIKGNYKKINIGDSSELEFY